MDYLPILPAADRRKWRLFIAGTGTNGQLEAGAASVPTRRLPVGRLIGRFQDLFQFDKGMADMMPEIAESLGHFDATFRL